MLQIPRISADPDNIATWAKYSARLCRSCAACCCSLPVEVKVTDLVRLGVMDDFEVADNPKLVARRLTKMGLIDHFHARTATFTLSRRASGDCQYLDNGSRRCTVYQSRPDTCRNHPHIGPRPGYCPYKSK